MLRHSWPQGRFLVLVLLPFAFIACKQDHKTTEITYTEPPTEPVWAVTPKPYSPPDYDTTQWTEITSHDGYMLDIRYATANNFTNEVIYPCGRMFLRPEVAQALDNVKKDMHARGFTLKLFDGYRPKQAQQKLWDKVPNPNYVAPPSEGSMHNRGVAIDLTITDVNGWDMDMGTPYDYFGPEAHHDYTNLSPSSLAQRKKLKEVMEAHGFQSIRTEWWHYSYGKGSYPMSDWQWPCKD